MGREYSLGPDSRSCVENCECQPRLLWEVQVNLLEDIVKSGTAERVIPRSNDCGGLLRRGLRD